MKRGPLADPRRNPLSPEAVERLVRARQEGLTWAQLAERFGRTARQMRLAHARATAPMRPESIAAMLRPQRAKGAP